MDMRRSSGLDWDTAAAALLRSAYRFAKTMPDSPHWYTLRESWWQTEDFEAVVQFIRDHGYREKYGRTTYTKLNVNGMKYWTMGAPLKDTILINRAYVEAPAPYDRIAPAYDALWSGPDALAEDAAVVDMLGYEPGEEVLDVGCGTGLLYDLLEQPAPYVGIDPSRGMLEQFLRKHEDLRVVDRPNAALSPLPDWLVPTPLESYCPVDRRFDLVVALYGTASYCTTAALQRIPAMLKPGGRYFLMFYRPSYEPRTERETGVLVPVHAHDPRTLMPGPWTMTEFGNYYVLEGRLL